MFTFKRDHETTFTAIGPNPVIVAMGFTQRHNSALFERVRYVGLTVLHEWCLHHCATPTSSTRGIRIHNRVGLLLGAGRHHTISDLWLQRPTIFPSIVLTQCAPAIIGVAIIYPMDR